MKPVQYAQVSYFAHFSRHILWFEFRDKRIFSFFYLFIFLLGGGGAGVAMEVILEDFINVIV